MKVVILAGGMGSRITEESRFKPKPMVEIGDKPILWHIMKSYAAYGFNEFIICCGYKGYMIKKYFLRYYMYQSDSHYDLDAQTIDIPHSRAEPWQVTMADTGLHTLTAGRILNIKEYIGDNDTFLLTYGDGVSDVNITELIEFHKKTGKTVTITTTQPPGRFGSIKIDETTGVIENFKEKAREDQSWVNAGFMVCSRRLFDYLGDGSTMLETKPFEQMAEEGQMSAYKHYGFWSPMDTMRDKTYLEELWNSGRAPWKVWE